MAENYKVHVERIYCGSAEHLKDYAGELHSFAQELAYLPVVSSTTDFCAYVAEGDSANTVLYGALSLAEILSLGSASFVKSGGRLAVGAGAKEAVEDVAKAAAGFDYQQYKTLSVNMKHAGIEKPIDYSSAAHHIVAKGATDINAVKSREILQKYGIDVSNAANGVYLRTTKEVTEGAYHPSLHTQDYYQLVYDQLKTPSSKEEVLSNLYLIREGLENDVF